MTPITWVSLVPTLVTMVFVVLAYSVAVENRAAIRKMECQDRNIEANTAALLRIAEAIEAVAGIRPRADARGVPS